MVVGPVLETLYFLDIILFGGLIGYLIFASYPRRRGDYEVYEGDGVVVIDEATGEIRRVRPVRIAVVDARPKAVIQCYYAEGLQNTAWTGKQDVVAQVEISDCGAMDLGKARTATVHNAGSAPRWHDVGASGVVTVFLPWHRLDLSRLTVRVKLFAVNGFGGSERLVGSAHVPGTLADVAHGNPVDCAVTPRGTLVLGIALQNVNTQFSDDVPPVGTTTTESVGTSATTTATGQPLPVAIARPLP